jgi:hypothetical protein
VRPFYYSQVRVDPRDPDRVYWSSTPVNYSNDGGMTAGTTTIDVHVDHHAMWIDPADPDHIIVGNDGGVAVTYDKGGNWDFLNTFPLGQFYNVSYGMEVPYRVCGGLQDNGSWCGPSRRANGEITNHMWATISGGDGFVTQQDPVDHHVVYAESQGGNMARINLRSGERTSLRKPSWLDRWRMLEDSILIYRGEGAPPPEVEQRIAALRAQQTADSAAFALRWNWNTPFLLSPHDRRVFYAGANRVLKSTNRGEDLTPISPDLTYADTMKIRISTQETGGITTDATGAETYGTIVSLAESPRRAGWLFAGTDDGRVWMTRDDGANWTELTSRFRGVPANTYVSRIEPSSHDENVLYVTFDGHRTGDFTPHVFMTSDGARSFRSIAGGLPSGGIDFVHVIREDPVSPNVLYVGSDVGLYVSLDRGATWRRFMNGMGTVPVHDLKIHPRDHELIAGTHGRAILVTDVAPLQQLAGPAAPSQITFFSPKPGLQFGDPYIGGESTGQRLFQGDNVDYGAELTYWVPPVAAAADADTEGEGGPRGVTSDAPASNGTRRPQRQERAQASIAILDAQGDTVQTMNGPATAGLHRVYWNYRTRQTERTLSPSEKADSAALIARVTELADSLLAAGADSAAIARVRAAIASGDIRSLFRRGGGGGGAGPGVQNLRPGETPPRAGGAGAADVGRDIFTRLRREGGAVSRGLQATGGGFGGPSIPPAAPGRYTVHLTVGGQTFTQPLEVVRAPNYTEDLTMR